MNWLQILQLVVQAAPQVLDLGLEVTQMIVAITHAAAQAPAASHAAITMAANAAKAQSPKA
jgi:hypothetical protein